MRLDLYKTMYCMYNVLRSCKISNFLYSQPIVGTSMNHSAKCRNHNVQYCTYKFFLMEKIANTHFLHFLRSYNFNFKYSMFKNLDEKLYQICSISDEISNILILPFLCLFFRCLIEKTFRGYRSVT